MIIRKEYNVELLSAELTKEVIEAERVSNFYVKVPILVAKDIVDVLDETLEMEKRNQTLESELQFVETEDEGQTNEETQETLPDCFKITKPECFGTSNDRFKCDDECNFRDECLKKYLKTKKPSCFRHFYENCKQCDNDECIHRTECKEKSINE